MLEMEKLTKIFVTDSVETHALSAISISIASGEFVALTGPSGSGKSTFLSIAGLLDVASSGTHKLDDRDVSNLSDRQRSLIRREIIGFIFQGFNLLPDLSVADNVELPLRLRGLKRRDRKQRVSTALKTVGLSTRKSHYPTQLSGGQQQRAAIARAIAGDPKLVLADEPTGNLDSKMSDQIIELLKEINAMGSTIIMVTHDDSHAKASSRIINIRDGKIFTDAGRPQLLAQAV